jgi:lambda repressor-like predicted transcriptional regulator
MAKTPLMFRTVNQPHKRLVENKAVAIRYRQSKAAIAYFAAFRDMRAAIDEAVKRKNMKLRKLAQAHGFEYDKVYRVYKLNADYPDGRAAIAEFVERPFDQLWPTISDTISGGGKKPILRIDL